MMYAHRFVRTMERLGMSTASPNQPILDATTSKTDRRHAAFVAAAPGLVIVVDGYLN